MSGPGGTDELRARLRRVEQDAAAARILAGGADRDVAEFRGEVRAEFADVRAELRGFRDQNNRVLSAMRADLTDLREHVDRNFLIVHSKLDGVAAGLHVITDLLGRRESDDRPQG